MPAVRAQLEKAKAARCRVRERQETAQLGPYTEDQIDLFALRLGLALLKPGAFDPICDRIDDLLKRAKLVE